MSKPIVLAMLWLVANERAVLSEAADSTVMLEVINDVVSHLKAHSRQDVIIFWMYQRTSDLFVVIKLMRWMLEKSKLSRHRLYYISNVETMNDNSMNGKCIQRVIVDLTSVRTNNSTCNMYLKAFEPRRIQPVVHLAITDTVDCQCANCPSLVIGRPYGQSWQFRESGKSEVSATWQHGRGIVGSLLQQRFPEKVWRVLVCHDPPYTSINILSNGTKIVEGYLFDIWLLLAEKFNIRYQLIFSKHKERGTKTSSCALGKTCTQKVQFKYSGCLEELVQLNPDIALIATADYFSPSLTIYEHVPFGLSGRGMLYRGKEFWPGWKVPTGRGVLEVGVVLLLAWVLALVLAGASTHRLVALLLQQRTVVPRGWRGRPSLRLSAVPVALFWVVITANFTSIRLSFRSDKLTCNDTINGRRIYISSSSIQEFFFAWPTPYRWLSSQFVEDNARSVEDGEKLFGYLTQHPNTFGVVERERALPAYNGWARERVDELPIYDRSPVGFLLRRGIDPTHLIKQRILELIECGVVEALYEKWWKEEIALYREWMPLQEDLYLPLGVLLVGAGLSMGVLLLEKQAMRKPTRQI